MNSPLHVVMCHYKDDARAGGSLRVGQMLANRFNPELVEAHLVFVYENAGPVAATAKIPCFFPQVKHRWDFFGWYKTAHLIQNLQPHIIHFQDPLFILRLFLLATKAVKITHCHGRPLFPPRTILQKLAGQWQKLTTDRFVCINASAADALIKFGLAQHSQCQVLPNAIDVKSFQVLPERQTARATLGLPSDRKLLGLVGRVIETKGFPDFFQILLKLPPEWQGVVVGDGEDRARLEQQAHQLNLRDRLHFVGSLNDVRVAYAALDAVIFLCHHEPFGLVIAEAMAARVPLFGLHGLGEYRELHPPLVDDSIATFWERIHPERLLEPSQQSIPEAEDVLDQLVDAIANFDHNQSLLKAKSEAAWQRVQQHYDIELQVQRMTAIYQNLIAQCYDSA